jgi:hypothetical protein
MTRTARNQGGLHEQTRTPSRKMVQRKGFRKAGSQSEVRCAIRLRYRREGMDDALRGPAAQAQKVEAAARREGGGSGAARGGPHSDGSCSESFVPFESSNRNTIGVSDLSPFLNWPTRQPIRVGDLRPPDGAVAALPRKTPRARRGRRVWTSFYLPDLRTHVVCLNPTAVAWVHCAGPSEVADKRQKTARRETARIGTSSISGLGTEKRRPGFDARFDYAGESMAAYKRKLVRLYGADSSEVANDPLLSGPGTEKRRTRNTPPPSTRGRKVAGARAHPLPDTDLTRATPPGGRRRAALARKRPQGKSAPGFGGEMPHKRREVWE